jgi:hypothetical protein
MSMAITEARTEAAPARTMATQAAPEPEEAPKVRAPASYQSFVFELEKLTRLEQRIEIGRDLTAKA